MNSSNSSKPEAINKDDDADILVLEYSDSEHGCDDIPAESKFDCDTVDIFDEDCDDDGINVVINNIPACPKTQPLVDELTRIDEAMIRFNIYSPQADDLAINAELQVLVSNSINPKTLKCVTVKFQNQIILIPHTVAISSRLASLFWAYPKQYQLMTLPFHQEFDNNMTKCRKNRNLWPKTYPDNIPMSDKIGIFAAKYKKNIIATDLYRNSTDYEGMQNEKIKHSSSGIYQYCDFALLIIENGVIIDYAIHGFRSNIAECVRKHNPTKIFYNSMPGDALDVFMKYPYQPFFTSMADILMPVKIYRLPENFNSMSFCERNDVYCALCSAIKDFRGMMFQMPKQQITNGQERRYPRQWHRGNHTKNLAKNQFGQPIHQNQLKLSRAPKGPARFKPYFVN